jgi:hypothetical protein
MKKYYLALMILLTGPFCARANETFFNITFDSPVQSGSLGDFLQFFGTITNTSGSTVYLNSDNFDLTGFNYGTDVTDYFAITPVSLDAGASSGDMELFDITIPNPFTDGCVALADCGGSYQILGGADSNAQNVLGTAYFTIDVQQASGVPEPSYVVLLSGALVLLFVVKTMIGR